MLVELKELIRLQEIDSVMMDLEADKGDLPEQLGKLSVDIEEHRRNIVRSEGELAEINVKRKEEQRLLDDARERLKKSQAVLFNVKTTREYDAISAEIEQAKGQIAESERSLLELAGRHEVIGAGMGHEKERLGSIEAEHREKEGEMNERFEGNQDVVDEMQAERLKIVSRLKRPIYAHYERIRKIRDGVGVSFLTENACSYCYNRIPPQRQAEIRRMDDMILCEVCGCILVAEQK